MRQSERINEILGLIDQIWNAHQDYRLMQLIYILQSRYSEKHNGYGKVSSGDSSTAISTGFDFFNLEDDELISFLNDFIVDD